MAKEYLEIPVEGRCCGISLVVYPLNSKAKVFEEREPLAGESRWQLVEGGTYAYEFVGGRCQFDRENEIVRFHPNRVSHASEGTLTTGIHVGHLAMDVVAVNCGEQVGRVSMEIRSTKAEYRSDYRLMLDEIAEYYTDLVLQQGLPVTQRLEIDRSSSSKTLYQRFSFVRSLIDSDSSSEAIHKIISNPVKKWTDTNVERNIVGVRRLNRKNIRQIASSTDRVPLTTGMRTGMPEGLTSVPRRIEVDYKRDTTDCLENQFVKFVLRTFANFCSEIQNFPNANERLKAEAMETTERLYEHLDNQFFRQISQPSHMNMNSPVLQRKEGYREVLQAWLLFDLAAKLNWTGGDDVYDAGKKNVAVLYEYWLFFKLLELVSEFFHIEPQTMKELVQTDKDGIDLSLRQGRMKMVSGRQKTFSRVLNVAFYYNRTFNKVSEENDPIHKAGSWTMTMRPDYTLSLWPGEIDEKEAERQELIVHIHFDAKYRLNKVLLEDKDVETDIEVNLAEEKREQELKIYKRGDLLKMHAYKDAIRRTSGAYVLYPGEENRNLRGFHEIVPGLGAFSIRPGHWLEDSVHLKHFLAEVKAHLMDRTSDREKLSYYEYDIHREAKDTVVMESLPEAEGDNRDFLPDETWVVLGYVKNEKQLAWIRKTGLYNFRTGTQKGSVRLSRNLVLSRYLLLHAHGESIEFIRLADEGPRVFRRSELLRLGYPLSEDEEKKKDDIYIVYRLEPERTEPEWAQYKWNIREVSTKRGNQTAVPEPVKLSNLMKNLKNRQS